MYQVKNNSYRYTVVVNDGQFISDNNCCPDEQRFINSTLVNAVTGATNLGNGIGIFKEKVRKHLNFKTLVAGENISIIPSANTITISSTGGIGSETVTGATNGLSIESKNVKLGGSPITEDTILSLVDDTSFKITGSTTGGITNSFNVTPVSTTIETSFSDGNTLIETAGDYVSLIAVSGDTNLEFRVEANRVNVAADEDIFKGITYDSDYSPNYILRSLIDKGFLLSKISGLTGTSNIQAANGLTKTDNVIKLGGIVSGYTELQITNDVEAGDIVINDQRNGGTGGGGIKYAQDLTDSYDDLSLVHKAYVDIVSGTFASNGLSKQGQTIVLGGQLTGTTNVFGYGSDPVELNISVQRTDLAGEPSSSISLGSAAAVSITSARDGGNLGNYVFSSSNSGIEIRDYNIGGDGDDVRIKVSRSSHGLLITDTRTGSTRTGIEYAGNYASGFTDSSLVNKKYVLSLTSGSTSTPTLAANGLTKVGNYIKLGGTITGSTVFTDNRATKLGLQYAANYTTGFTTLSLPHVGYVTGQTSTKLPISNFNTYSGNTQTTINSKLPTTIFATYTANTPSYYYRNIDREYFEQDDMFFAGTIGSSSHWQSSNSGTGSGSAQSTFGTSDSSNAFGVVAVSTGTQATGRATLSRSMVGFVLGRNTEIGIKFRAAISDLSDGTDTWSCGLGLFDNAGAGDATDAIYFRMNNALNPGKWTAVCRNNSSETTGQTNVTVVASTFAIFEILVNSAGNSAQFFIDGNLVSTLTTNIPTGSGRQTGISCKAEKSAGTNARNIYIDFYAFYLKRAANR